MQSFKNILNPKATPQTQPMPGVAQVKMRSGGFGFEVNNWVKLDRFLMIGTEGGTYYANERTLSKMSCDAVLALLKEGYGATVVERTREISQAGRAKKNDPALFVLAMCAKLGDEGTKTAAYRALPEVARIGTHLFHFAQYCADLGQLGGNGFKRALQRWYNNRSPRSLAMQVVKYQQRDGWSHKDLLRLGHPKPASELHNAIYAYVKNGRVDEHKNLNDVPEDVRIIWAWEKAKAATSAIEIVSLIGEHGLPHECVPNEFKSNPEVWRALLPHMGPEAVLRNLNKMTAVGLLTNMSEATQHIMKLFSDEPALKKARLHPMTVLLGARQYAQGQGDKGKLTWQPVPRILDACDKAFYSCFANVEPTNKRICYALDVSGSMCAAVSGLNMTCREAEAAMALVLMNTEPNHEVVGFTAAGTDSMPPIRTNCGYGLSCGRLALSPRMRLNDAAGYLANLPLGRTDCARPMLWAAHHGLVFDAFVIMTDNESYAGPIHVDQALRDYRKKFNPEAKLIACAFAANEYSVANPADSGQMDCVGLDSALPNIISEFIR